MQPFFVAEVGRRCTNRDLAGLLFCIPVFRKLQIAFDYSAFFVYTTIDILVKLAENTHCLV